MNACRKWYVFGVFGVHRNCSNLIWSHPLPDCIFSDLPRKKHVKPSRHEIWQVEVASRKWPWSHSLHVWSVGDSHSSMENVCQFKSSARVITIELEAKRWCFDCFGGDGPIADIFRWAVLPCALSWTRLATTPSWRTLNLSLGVSSWRTFAFVWPC